MSNVSIATRPLVYSTFRYINNKVWHALAEYIDNSIQSFQDHKEELQNLNRDGKLHVRIDIDFDNDTISIQDDAYGITKENYQRAFELANLPLDREGLHEFGMGMKVSSIWLCNTWTVETSAFGEPIRKTMTFDLEEVVAKEELELPVEEIQYDVSEHYTKISLTNLSMNKPTRRQLPYIKQHLASIYTKYLREDSIEIVINDEPLGYTDLRVLKAPLYSKPDSTPIVWRKDIAFEGYLGPKKYAVKGFIGILETMSTSENNGFLLFRRGRVIGSSYDDRYRPKVLCGQEGSPQYKRIFGELHLEGFDVSFTKNSFQEDNDFSQFIELLKDDLTRDKSLDLFGQAQNYTKPKTKKEIKDLGTSLIQQVAKGLSRSIDTTSKQDFRDERGLLFSASGEVHTDLSNNSSGGDADELNISPVTIEVTLSDGRKISLTIQGEKGSTISGLYKLEQTSEASYTATINMRNSIFDRFAKSLATEEGQEQLAYVIKVMVATEISLYSGAGAQSGVYFRNKFNDLFGAI